MVTDKLPEATIITRIQSGPDRFDLSPDGLVALSKAGVSKNILRAMMASNNQPAQSSTPSTPGGSGAISGAGNNPTPRNTATGTENQYRMLSAVKLTLGPKIKIAGRNTAKCEPNGFANTSATKPADACRENSYSGGGSGWNKSNWRVGNAYVRRHTCRWHLAGNKSHGRHPATLSSRSARSSWRFSRSTCVTIDAAKDRTFSSSRGAMSSR